MGRPKNSKNKTTIEKLVAQTTAAVPRSPNAVPPAYTTAGMMQPAPPLTNAQLFDELGTSGLMRFGGSIYEEWQRELMQKGKYAIYREMRDNNPVVNAVLFAVEMALRRVKFYFETENDKEEELKDFLNGSLDDMSLTFQDTMTQIVSELQYGFSVFELVYKIRKGQGGKVQSKFDDGRISWRKWLPLAQETLAPGREWIWDETGGVQGINQLAPPDYQLRTLPIEKLLLFQTTHYKNNPEGRSLLRSMYVPYYFVKNFQEIEGISYERMGAGIPVMYMGSDTIKSGGTKNDTDFAKQVVRDVRSDEQSGVVIPYQKMGPDGRGMLLELLSTPGRSVIDFDKVITRYEQRMAMSALAQFIMLGMSNVGSYALSKDHSDIFVLSLSAWAQNIADIITRHALPRLLALNTFTYDQMPQMMHSEVSVPDLQALGSFINQMVGAQLLIPDSNLENYLRDAAKLPKKEAGAPTVDDLRKQKQEQAQMLLEAQKQGTGQGGFPPKKEEQGTPTSAKAEPGKVAEAKAEAPKEKASEKFGGEGSGNFGHRGRPGEVGGSGEGGRQEEINNSRIVFHGTKQVCIKSILSKGILSSGTKKNYGMEFYSGARKDAVYFAEDFESAKTFAQEATKHGRGAWAVVKVRVPANSLVVDTRDKMTGGKSYYFKGNIPLGWIESVTHENMARQIVERKP